MTTDDSSPIVRWFGPAVVLLGAWAALAYPVNQAIDFQPFYIASHLVAQGKLDSVYVPPTATSLNDLPAEYVLEAEARIPDYLVALQTGFVAPPAVLWIMTPLSWLDYSTATTVWRALMAAVVSGSILGLMGIVPRQANTEAAMSALLVPMGLVAWYTVAAGQNTPLVLAAAVALVRLGPATQSLSTAVLLAAVTLALAIVFKLFPLLLVVPLLAAGHWRVAGLAAGLAGLVGTLAWLVGPAELTSAFLQTAAGLSRGIITSWPSLSLDAAIARLWYGQASGQFLLLPDALAWALKAMKGGVFLAACLLCLPAAGLPHAQRMTVALAGLLAVVPLVWYHYLLVVPVLMLPVLPTRLGHLAVACGWGLGLVPVVRAATGQHMTAAHLGTLLWLVILGLTFALAVQRSLAAETHPRPSEEPPGS